MIRSKQVINPDESVRGDIRKFADFAPAVSGSSL